VSRLALLAVLIALVASACARTETLGPDEAIEVMVLDGVNRARATCILATLDGQLDLEKVTGLDVDLDENELAMLSTASMVCAPALAGGGGIIGGSGFLDEEGIQAQHDAATLENRIEDRVYALVEEGLDPAIGNCLIAAVAVLDDPQTALDDVFNLSSMIVDCREQLG
jgi:hypothetical protein